MDKKELAKQYSFNIPSEIYNTLGTDADRLLWKSETERAFEAGYDAGKQENEHLVWQISEANYEKGKKEIIDKAYEWLKIEFRDNKLVEMFRKAMEE